jgi:hypothetical protein
MSKQLCEWEGAEVGPRTGAGAEQISAEKSKTYLSLLLPNPRFEALATGAGCPFFDGELHSVMCTQAMNFTL